MVCADSPNHTYCSGFSGKSRSSTITLAFLIQKTNLTLEEAIVQVVTIDLNCHDIVVVNCDTVQVKTARTINPNLGFLTALVELEESLASGKNL